MRRGPRWLLFGLALMCGGCVSLPVAHLQADPVPPTDKLQFVDKRASPEDSAYLIGEGNVYSCHYAIKKIDEKALDPDRMVLLRSFLDAKVFADDKPHTVTVTRFDIYWNRQRNVTYGVTLFRPSRMVGCADAEQGEYDISEAPGERSAPIVIYLHADVDGKDYSVRTVYEVETDHDGQVLWNDSLDKAIAKTFATLKDVMASPGAN